MGTTEKRIQRKARETHGCDICGRTIFENSDYIAITHQKSDGLRVRYKRHIHCDALIRLYAEKYGVNPADVKTREALAWLETVCEDECLRGFSKQCRHDRFSCEHVLWFLLRHRPGYSAVVKSAQQNGRDGDDP